MFEVTVISIPDPILSPYYPSTSGCLPHDLIPHCRAHLTSLDGAIHQLEQSIIRFRDREDSELLQNAQIRLQQLSEERAKCTSLLAPIRQLPLEILANVVLHVFDCPKMLYRLHVRRITSIQLVCRMWRDATYATCDLWKNFAFSTARLRRDLLDCGFTMGDILGKWFSHAGVYGPRELSLAVHSSHFPNVADKDIHLHSLRSFLVGTPRPFSKLSLDTDSIFIKDILEDISKSGSLSYSSPWANLRHLALHCGDRGVNDNQQMTHISLPACALPRMSYLQVAYATLEPFEHASLCTLDLKGADYHCSQLASLLSQLPSLKKFIMGAEDVNIREEYSEEDRSKLSRITISHLCIQGPRLPALTKYFVFPLVQILEVAPGGRLSGEDWLREVPPFLQVLSGIHTLLLRRFSYPPDVANALSSIRPIRRLDVCSLNFFLHMSSPQSQATLEPILQERLERIAIDDPPSRKALEAMAEYFTYWWGIRDEGRSRRVQLHSKKGWPEGFSDVQGRLARAGIDIVSTPCQYW